MGKYVLSPYAIANADGGFTALLSMRSGHGEGTHDRVFRFVSEFSSRQAAEAYAMAQGADLLRQCA